MKRPGVLCVIPENVCCEIQKYALNSLAGKNADMRHFLTSFVPDLVTMSVFRLKLHVVVIMKALLSLYNIKPSTIHEA